MRLELSRFVENDLEAIAEFIAADNPRRAITFIHKIRDKRYRIAEQPLLYQLLLRSGRTRGSRSSVTT